MMTYKYNRNKLSRELVLAIPVVFLMLFTIVAQPISAQESNTTSTNTTTTITNTTTTPPSNTTAGDNEKLRGLLIALERMYNITWRFLERTGVPEDSDLWSELREIGQKIDTLRQILENGTIEDPDEIAREYSGLFKEMAEIIVKAAHWKMEEREEVREAVKELIELIQKERKMLVALNIVEKRVERLINMSIELNCTLPINYTKLLDRLEDLKTNVSLLLNETRQTIEMLRAGNITAEEAEEIADRIEEKLDIIEDEVEELLKIKYPLYFIIMCRVVPVLEDYVEKINEHIEELEDLIEEIQNVTGGNITPGLEKLLKDLEEKKTKLEELLEKLQTGNLTPLEALYLLRIKHMMPDIEDIVEEHIERIKHAKEIYEEIREEEEYGKSIIRLPDILPLLPKEYQELLANTSREVLQAHKAYIGYLRGEVSKEDVLRELVEARTALEKAKREFEAFLEKRKGMWRMIERYLDRLENILDRIEEGLEEQVPPPPPMQRPPHKGVIKALMKIEATLERLEEIADRLDRELVEEKLDKAQDHVEEARDYISEGEVQKAISELEKAKSILEDVLEIVEDDEELAEHIVNTINEVIDLIERIIGLLES